MIYEWFLVSGFRERIKEFAKKIHIIPYKWGLAPNFNKLGRGHPKKHPQNFLSKSMHQLNKSQKWDIT